MSITEWLTLVGIATAILVPAVGWLVVSHISVMVKVGRIEAVLSMMGRKALEALHSPHTPVFDRLIEKFVEPGKVLTTEEWSQLNDWVKAIHTNPKEEDEKRALALFVAALIRKNFLTPDRTPPDV